MADSREDLAFARGLLDGSVEVPGLKVDTDLRWQIVGTLAASGVHDGQALIAAELERDPTDIGERRAASARASLPRPEAKADGWARATSPGVHLAIARSIAGGFWQYGQDSLLEPYVGIYFDSILDWWAQRGREEAIGLANGLYPRTLVEPQVIEATDHALADEGLPGPIRRILLEGKDSMERAVRARAADVAHDEVAVAG